MDTRTLLRERLRRSRDWSATIDELEKELEASGSKPEQSERLFELATLVEDVIPERERALGLYQRAWKLYPDNLKALSRAREVYGEIGRFEMVAKLGEMELRSPLAPINLAQIVGEAMLDSGQRDKAGPILERALELNPDSVRVQDALLTLDYDPEFWTDQVERLTSQADKFDDATQVRMLVRAARILRIEAPDDERLEETVKRILALDINEASANFIYETVLAKNERWDELEAHHKRRAERAPDHAQRVEALRMFALEWVQRFKDRNRGAKFFEAAFRATASNGAAPMRSVVAAFTLLRQVYGERNEWNELLGAAESILDGEVLEQSLPLGDGELDVARDEVAELSGVRDGIEYMIRMTDDKFPVKYKGPAADLYAWYYNTQACLMFGGSAWSKWNRWFQDEICDVQNPDGSWPIPGGKAHGPQTGDNKTGAVYRTTLCILMLEVFYRYMPTTQG